MSSEFNLVELHKGFCFVFQQVVDTCGLVLAFGLCSAFTVVPTVVLKFPKGITEPEVSTVLEELLTYPL